jgi:uncharacterized protein YkwD
MAFFDRSKYVCGNSKGGLVKGAALTILISASLIMAIIAPSVPSRLMQSAADVEPTAATDNVDRSSSSATTSGDSDNELEQYALQRINEDRAKFGISQVSLGDNMAAQVHAEDILKTRVTSHWTTDGEKPYMTYSRLGGEGAVAQNVATSGYPQDYDGCSSGALKCDKIDPRSAIDRLEYNMMNADKACCNNGHRNNILDKHHTHVDIGIAYDDYFFVLVQNFENKYIEWTHKIGENEVDTIITNNNDNGDNNNDNSSHQLKPTTTTMTMAGSFIDKSGSSSSTNSINSKNNDGNSLSLANVQVYFDSLPTPDVYSEHKDDKFYGLGELVGLVVEPAPPGTAYKQPANFTLVEAQNWQVEDSTFDITFSLQRLYDTYGNGVYTIILLAKDSEDDSFVTSETSVFLNQ